MSACDIIHGNFFDLNGFYKINKKNEQITEELRESIYSHMDIKELSTESDSQIPKLKKSYI